MENYDYTRLPQLKDVYAILFFCFLRLQIIFYSVYSATNVVQHRIKRMKSLKYLANILYIVYGLFLDAYIISSLCKKTFNAIQFENALAY